MQLIGLPSAASAAAHRPAAAVWAPGAAVAGRPLCGGPVRPLPGCAGGVLLEAVIVTAGIMPSRGYQPISNGQIGKRTSRDEPDLLVGHADRKGRGKSCALRSAALGSLSGSTLITIMASFAAPAVPASCRDAPVADRPHRTGSAAGASHHTRRGLAIAGPHAPPGPSVSPSPRSGRHVHRHPGLASPAPAARRAPAVAPLARALARAIDVLIIVWSVPGKLARSEERLSLTSVTRA